MSSTAALQALQRVVKAHNGYVLAESAEPVKVWAGGLELLQFSEEGTEQAACELDAALRAAARLIERTPEYAAVRALADLLAHDASCVAAERTHDPEQCHAAAVNLAVAVDRAGQVLGAEA